MDKYQLLLLLKEFYQEDDQCGGNCFDCDMAEECGRLNGVLEQVF